MKSIQTKALVSAAFLLISTSNANAAMADMFYGLGQRLSTCTLDCAHWYVSGNIGMSHLYDQRTAGIPSSMNENGPGWNVNGGYQLNSILGGELGYTQYHDSRETIGSFNIAKTEHYAVHLAATGRYPFACRWSVIGKLGAAYSYMNKIFTGFGAAAASGAVSPYGGLGIAYSMTPRADLVAQWAAVRGNHLTGSSALYSLGMTFAIV